MIAKASRPLKVVGFADDVGKRIKGRKRITFTDTNGFMVRLIVRSTAVRDRDGAVPVLQAAPVYIRLSAIPSQIEATLATNLGRL